MAGVPTVSTVSTTLTNAPELGENGAKQAPRFAEIWKELLDEFKVHLEKGNFRSAKEVLRNLIGRVKELGNPLKYVQELTNLKPMLEEILGREEAAEVLEMIQMISKLGPAAGPSFASLAALLVLIVFLVWWFKSQEPQPQRRSSLLNRMFDPHLGVARILQHSKTQALAEVRKQCPCSQRAATANALVAVGGGPTGMQGGASGQSGSPQPAPNRRPNPLELPSPRGTPFPLPNGKGKPSETMPQPVQGTCFWPLCMKISGHGRN